MATKNVKVNVKANTSQAQTSINNLSGQLKKLGNTIAGVFAVKAIINFGKASVDAYNKQIQAETKLKTAIGETSFALKEQASALQKLTTYGDEQTLQAAATLATFGATEKQIQQLIPLVQDYATSMGIDLDMAAKKVGNTIFGTSTTLKGLDVQFKQSSTQTEKFSGVMEGLKKNFEGQAQAAAKVGTGPLLQFKNTIGDLQEKLGGVIVEGLTPMTEGLSILATQLDNYLSLQPAEELRIEQVAFNKLAKEVESGNIPQEERIKKIKEMQKLNPDFLKGLDAATVSEEQLKTAIDNTNLSYESRINQLKNQTYLKLLKEQMAEISQALVRNEQFLNAETAKATDDRVKLQKEKYGAFANWFDGIAQKMTSALHSIGLIDDYMYYSSLTMLKKQNEDMAKYQEGLQKEIDDRTKKAETLDGILKSMVAGFGHEVEETTKKTSEELKKIYEKTLKEREAFEKEMRTFGLHGMELELENERIWYEEKLKEFQKFGGDIELLNREHYLRMADISAKYMKDEIDKLVEWKDEYDKLLQDDEEDKYMIVDEAMKKRGEMRLLNLQEQKQLEKDMLIENWDWTVLGNEELNAKLAEIDQKYADEEYKRKLDNTNKNIDLVGGFFSTSLQAAKLFGVKSREIQKAQALVDISINTAKAIAFAVAGATKTSLTPVDFGIQLTAYIGAIIASMAQAKQAFAKAADGGLIYGNSHANGGVIIEAEGGEAIINKKSTAMFAPQLSAINQAMGGKPIGNQTGQLIDYDLLASKINDKRVILVASDVTNQQATDVKVKSTAKL